MASVNKVILIGFLGKDVEVKNLESGSKVATFSLATAEKYKQKDGNMQEKTEWHQIVCWNKLAEIAEKYLKKGSKVFIEGKITYRKYTDKNQTERTTTDIIATGFTMLDSRQENRAQEADELQDLNVPNVPITGNLPETSDDLPF